VYISDTFFDKVPAAHFENAPPGHS
jgi:hypothetical protein